MWRTLAGSMIRETCSHLCSGLLHLPHRVRAAGGTQGAEHLIRFHGVLAPHAKLRAAIVPVPAQTTAAHAADCEHAHGASARMGWARLLKRVFDIDVERCGLAKNGV